MNYSLIKQAVLALGHEEPISIEPDGTVWLGADDDRTYPNMAPILAEVERIKAERQDRKNQILDRLGLTLEEVKLLLS